MFEFGRELRRLFRSDPPFAAPRDGLTGGDPALLELLDLDMLRAEARAADIAAGRVGAKDRARLRLTAAGVWRELARRTGDPVVLRKAASAAEIAASDFDLERRREGWAAARCEQALAAMLGAELFGDDGLNAAADFALAEAQAAAPNALAGAQACAARVGLEARSVLASGDAIAARAAAARFDGPIAALKAHGRNQRHGLLRIVHAQADRSDALAACGARLRDRGLLELALRQLDQISAGLDPAYEPLSWARIEGLRGSTQVALGEVLGDVGRIADGVNRLTGVLEQLTRDHSPLDWARAQHGLAMALQALGEATESERAFEQASACYDRSLTVLRREPSLTLRAFAAHNRAVCLTRAAELTCDLAGLAKAEMAFRAELRAASPAKDPVAWAVCQMNLARLYEARVEVSGRDNGERADAAEALAAALEVFGEHGLRSLADEAHRALERMRERIITPQP